MSKSADLFMPGVIENYKKMSHLAVHDTPFVVSSLEEPGIVGESVSGSAGSASCNILCDPDPGAGIFCMAGKDHSWCGDPCAEI